MKRIDAIKEVMKGVSDELVVATTGMISRELYATKDRPENFYMCGSMGLALPIALGLALNTTRKVIVLDGDGAALMALGGLVLEKKLGLGNLTHFVLDNGVYASTGNQPTCSDAVDFVEIANVSVIKIEPGNVQGIPRIPFTGKQITKRFIESIRGEYREA